MQLPASLLDSLEGLPGYDRSLFEAAHTTTESITSIRINPAKSVPLPYIMESVPWTTTGHYVSPRPSFTFDPFFHGGAYYVQEASSMLLEQAFLQTGFSNQAIRALDLCAAPGGKSTHLLSLLGSNSLLVANEVIRTRSGLLRDNIIKWAANNVVVTQNDPIQFERLPDYFDWITLDAPCSGSGLFRKDHTVAEAWTLSQVNHCALRQQRILHSAWKALKPGGILFYSTCSFSPEENEDIVGWLIKEYGAIFQSIQLDPSWGIVESTNGYRCWPHRVKGEGFFFSSLRKPDSTATINQYVRVTKSKPINISSRYPSIADWINLDEMDVMEIGDELMVFPKVLQTDWLTIQQSLHPIYLGTLLGRWMHNKLIPAHALALSTRLSPEVTQLSLDYRQSIAYLQRKDLNITFTAKGWVVANYQGLSLGWLNVLSGRANNYYPKGLRILKEHL
ncbi:MAG: Fmu (Sun) domain protein [Bacteroidetes bacterium]|nr:Fmu (Sun) domain protein [Bacteroidota bacterium]